MCLGPEVLWVHTAGESIPNDSTVIFACDCMDRCVLVSQIHLAELCRETLKGCHTSWDIIGMLIQAKSDNHDIIYASIFIAAREVDSEDGF